MTETAGATARDVRKLLATVRSASFIEGAEEWKGGSGRRQEREGERARVAAEQIAVIVDAHKALEDAARDALNAMTVETRAGNRWVSGGPASKYRDARAALRTALQAIDEARGTT